MTVAVEGATKTYRTSRRGPGVRALAGIDLQVDAGELLAIVGPSGSGKSTLLRAIAGLEALDGGSVLIGGRDVSSEPPGERDVAMVFQEYALYPHLTVAGNIGFGLKARKVERSAMDKAVHDAALALGIEATLERRPDELSGGERQRVALARALVRQPKVFLMDEPLSNLDAELRVRMRREIKALQRRLGTTTIYVTHDQTEAMTLGDRVAVLNEGELGQVGTPRDLFDEPANTFVARFIGSPAMNVFPAELIGEGEGSCGVRVGDLAIAEPGDLQGVVDVVEIVGDDAFVHVVVGDREMIVRTGRDSAPGEGAQVALAIDRSKIHRFDDAGNRR